MSQKSFNIAVSFKYNDTDIKNITEILKIFTKKEEFVILSIKYLIKI